MRFHLLDVFTHERFQGAPFTLFVGADALSSNAAATLAREFARGNAAFLSSPRDQVNSAGMRIFSPRGEKQPFIAEALIGAATTLAQSRAAEVLARRSVVIVLEVHNDAYICEVIRNKNGLCYAQFAFKERPKLMRSAPNAPQLAAMLALDEQDIGFAAHAPRIYRAQADFCFAPIASRSALVRATLRLDRAQTWLGDVDGLYLYTADTVSSEAAIYARCFDRDGREMAASGDALAAFAGVACEFEAPEDGEHEFFIEQGHTMGRASRLTLRMEVEKGTVIHTYLGGQAVTIAGGELHL